MGYFFIFFNNVRTNLEMVRILKLFNGTNDIEAKTGRGRKMKRYTYKYEYIRNHTSGGYACQVEINCPLCG